MASETKVGLIAGLTFIICFAVILANRGRKEFATLDTPQQGELRGPSAGDWQIPSSTATDQESPFGVARKAGVPAHRPPAPRRSRQASQRAQRAANTRAGDLETSHDQDPAFEHTPVAQAEQVLPHSPIDESPEQLGGRDSHGTALISTSGDADSRLTLLERRLKELAEDVTASRKSTTVRVDDPRRRGGRKDAFKPASSLPVREAQAPRMVRHTVVSGETLSKIADAHYGRKSARYVRAIFDVNRSVLSSPDVLLPGMELVIPYIEGTTSAAGASSGLTKPKPARQSSPASREPPRPIRSYQIRKNDRYSSIAREQLGDVSRWPEIHELNKDKFPNPELIREGVRIRLPARRLAAAVEGRR